MSTTIYKIKDYKSAEITFTRISNDTLWDKRLSWGARGLLAYILSKPDNYNLGYADLKRNSPAKDKALKTIIQELSDFGYLNINERVPDAKPEPSTKHKSGWNWRYQVFEIWRHNKLYQAELKAKKNDREKSIETIEPAIVPVENIGIQPLGMDAQSMDAASIVPKSIPPLSRDANWGDIETTSLGETTKEGFSHPFEGVPSPSQEKENKEPEPELVQPIEQPPTPNPPVWQPSDFFYIRGVKIPKQYFDSVFTDNPCLYPDDVIDRFIQTSKVTSWYGLTVDPTGTKPVFIKIFPNGLPIELSAPLEALPRACYVSF